MKAYKNCTDCPAHNILPDPDPDDWFCDDDVKVVCEHMRGKNITVACRPYNIRKECAVPSWCPLLTSEKSPKRAAKPQKVVPICPHN